MCLVGGSWKYDKRDIIVLYIGYSTGNAIISIVVKSYLSVLLELWNLDLEIRCTRLNHDDDKLIFSTCIKKKLIRQVVV